MVIHCSLVDMQIGIPCIIRFITVFQLSVFENCCPQAFSACIPAAELEVRDIGISEKAILHVLNHRAATRLSRDSQF